MIWQGRLDHTVSCVPLGGPSPAGTPGASLQRGDRHAEGEKAKRTNARTMWDKKKIACYLLLAARTYAHVEVVVGVLRGGAEAFAPLKSGSFSSSLDALGCLLAGAD